MKCVAIILALLASAALPGCSAPPEPKPVTIAESSVDLSQLFARRRTAASDRQDAVPAHLNTPRAAAQEIATRAGAIDRSTERLVRLHAAMYRAAIDADQLKHGGYLLNPVDDAGVVPGEAISKREFRLRVLASLTSMTKPVAWDAEELTWMFDERAPGGAAALAWFEVVRENAELASIEADVCIESPHAGTRKFRVEAIYDGQRWTIRDLGARTIY